jgi:hypothetical protein
MKRYTHLFLGLIFISLGSKAYALETDNYLTWGLNLGDSSEEISSFIAEQIESALAKSGEQESPQSCEDVTFEIAKRFKTTPTTKSLETFVNETLDKEKIFPKNPYYLEQSILKNSSRFYLKYSGLSPNLQMNGIYFGADKLSHFASTGRRYLKHYLKKMKKGYSEQEAMESMVRYGLLNEQTVLGVWPSGVFSYADVEANYQGFVFYKKLCLDEKETYLSKNEEGKWFLKNKPDMKNYVSPFWDETYNLSYFAKGTWKRTSLVIQEQYCSLMTSPAVIERMSFYRSSPHTSFSLNTIKELQANGYKRAPVPEDTQSIDELCQLSNVAQI